MPKRKKSEELSLSEKEKEFLAKNPHLAQKRVFSFRIPFALRTALAFTVFFTIIGIVIQSTVAGAFVFKDFFLGNYADWLRAFGNFSSSVSYGSLDALLLSIFRRWYYFFYTGGLISLVWTLVNSIVHSEIQFTRKVK